MDRPFEPVHTMTDFYDGPRKGIANYDGSPHLYESHWDDRTQDWEPTYVLTPVDSQVFPLAVEDWEIWLRWQQQAFHDKQTMQETHPALPQDRSRHNELERELSERLVHDPATSFRASGDFRPAGDRFPGRALMVRWSPVQDVVSSTTVKDPGVAKRVGEIRTAFSPAINSKVVGYSTAEVQHDDGTWDAWPDLPIRLELDSGQVISVSWSKFDDLWIATDTLLPFAADGTTFRWVRNSIENLSPVVGGAIRSVMLGQGEMSIEGREIEIWTRLVIETDQGWLEVYNALDENGYDLHNDRPEGNFVPCA